MKLRNILGLLLATAALTACGAKKDNAAGAADGATDMAPPATEPAAPEIAPPGAETMPPGAVPEEGSMPPSSEAPTAPPGSDALDKAGEMMKEGAEEALDAAKDKAKEVITN
jgi:hypothetical protein